jgi:tetratricopeptide (TPR) repeat protein
MVRFRNQQAIAAWNWCRPVLAVVDYAAAKAELIHSWLKDLVAHPAWQDKDHPKLRLLLLERHGDTFSAWWRTAFGDGGEVAEAINNRLLIRGAPHKLSPIADLNQRFALFAHAFRLAKGADPPFVEELDTVLDAQSLGGEPLLLAMSGLIAAREGLPFAMTQTSDELAIGLAKRELQRIGTIWEGHGLPVHRAKPLHSHLAAFATLCGGLGSEMVHATIERECVALHLAASTGTEPIREALHAALPGPDEAIAPILPDILGEAAMLAAWGEGKQGLDAVRRAAADHWNEVTHVVVRTCQDFLARGHRAPFAWLRVLRANAESFDELAILRDAIPFHTVELRGIGIEIAQAAASSAAALRDNDVADEVARIAARRSAAPTGKDLANIEGTIRRSRQANSLNTLSARLSAQARYEEALTAAREAVAIWRQLENDRPGWRLYIALSLNNVSINLANLGHFEEALAAVQEAVGINRQLVADESNVAHLTELARSLHTLSLRLVELRRYNGVPAAIEEAVEIRRALAKSSPEKLSDLADSLYILSRQRAIFGSGEDALVAMEEAVKVLRRLATVDPDSFAVRLAVSLEAAGQFRLILRDPVMASRLFAEGVQVLERSVPTWSKNYPSLMTDFRKGLDQASKAPPPGSLSWERP